MTSPGSPGPAGHRLSMLAVMGSPARAAMYTHLAEQAGVQVIHADNALHALTQLERTRVSAIICDAQMPDMTGAEFCSVIEGDALTRRLPVFLVPQPGSHPEQTRRASLAAGPEVLGRAFHKLGLAPARFPVPVNVNAPAQLDGELGPFGMPDFLNWVAEMGFSGHWLLSMTTELGAVHSGHIAMRAGQVVYAEFGGLSGKTAVLGMLRSAATYEETAFRFYRCADLNLPVNAEFTQSTARLLIELAVSLDEAAAYH